MDKQDSPLSSLKELVRLSKLIPKESYQRMHPDGWVELPTWLAEFSNATVAAIPSLEAFLSRHEKLVAAAQKWRHAIGCNFIGSYHGFYGDSTRIDKYPTGICYECGEPESHSNHIIENQPCTCGLDELKRDIEGGPTA